MPTRTMLLRFLRATGASERDNKKDYNNEFHSCETVAPLDMFSIAESG